MADESDFRHDGHDFLLSLRQYLQLLVYFCPSKDIDFRPSSLQPVLLRHALRGLPAIAHDMHLTYFPALTGPR